MLNQRSLILSLVAVVLLNWNVGVRAADVVFKVVMVEDENEDPAAAGKAAAEALQKAMGDTAIKAVVMSECFEDREAKAKLLEGVCQVLPKEKIVGAATYGSFSQAGCTDFDAVCLLGIGGKGVKASSQIVKNMGTSKLTFEKDQDLIRERLHAAGEKLVGKLERHDDDRLLILLADAHSPKVQYLVEGAQKGVGKDFPITGGCANKNAGQTFVYFRGQMVDDAAVALMLSGNFRVALSGRMANEEQAVIQTAAEGAAEVVERIESPPAVVLSFNCAGRRSKLKEYEDELTAMQDVLGKETPLFGCYCAGEIGPLDEPGVPKDVVSGGSGWHVMFTAIVPTRSAQPDKTEKPPAGNVSGLLTLDGQPVSGGTVTFYSRTGKPVARGKSDPGGKYRVAMIEGGPDVPPGTYFVGLSASVDAGNGEQKELLHPKYTSPATSGLTVQVTGGGPNEFRFELVSR